MPETELDRISKAKGRLVESVGPAPNVVDWVDAEYAYRQLHHRAQKLTAQRRKVEKRKARVREVLAVTMPEQTRAGMPPAWVALKIRRAILIDQYYYPEAW